MPLRDHFHPPLSKLRSWDEVHGGWPMEIARELNKNLPPQYAAGPRIHLGKEAEVDVATFESQLPWSAEHSEPGDGGTAVAVGAPAEPTLAAETGMADFDEYEVRVHDVSGERRLVAVVELISPSNKDRPESRSQFTAKWASLLRQGVSIIVVDVVTERSASLYADFLDLIGQWDKSLGTEPPGTYAVACRWLPRGVRGRLEAWNRELKLGMPLPSLPLWLTEDLVLTLDLESSYEQTCRDLRIR